MDHQETIQTKKEETDCAPDPGLMCHQTLTVGHQQNIQIKEEKTDYDPDEPGFTFLEVPGLPIKPDPDLELHVDSSENNCVEYPLETSWTSDNIHEELAQNLEAEDTVNSVVGSTRCTQNSTRMIQNSGTSCGISFGETVVQGHTPSELEMHGEGSTSLAIFSTHTQRLEVNKDSLLVARLKCSSRENDFRKFICNFCLQSFSSKYRFIMHVFIHMDNVPPPRYICKSCGEIFSCEIGLKLHLKMNERDQSPSFGLSDKADYKHENIFLECNKVSVIQRSENQSSPELKSKALRVSGTKPYKCHFCGNYFAHLGSLKRHELIHSGMRPHKCNVCGKSFTESCYLKIHSSIHTGEKGHKCNVCGRSFKHLGTLKRHEEVHTGMRPHKCNVCDMVFTQLSDLNNHALTHSGEKRYKCNVCGKSFAHWGNFQSHATIHTGVKPHKCIVCDKSFTELRRLKRHSLIHTGVKPHKCNVCGKSFTLSCTLKTHALTHTGVKPHKCIICGKSFTKVGNLKTHALIHAGIKPHKCNVCGKSFSRLYGLRIHASIHT